MRISHTYPTHERKTQKTDPNNIRSPPTRPPFMKNQNQNQDQDQRASKQASKTARTIHSLRLISDIP